MVATITSSGLPGNNWWCVIGRAGAGRRIEVIAYQEIALLLLPPTVRTGSPPMRRRSCKIANGWKVACCYSSGWKSLVTLSFLDCVLKDSAEYLWSPQIKTKPFWVQSSWLASFHLSLYSFWLKCGLLLLVGNIFFIFSIPNCFFGDSAQH